MKRAVLRPKKSIGIDLPALLTHILDDIVIRFAAVMTPAGDDVLRTEAGLYRAIRDACDLKAKTADAFGRQDSPA